MPYINKEARHSVRQQGPATAGQLNYLYDSVNATIPDDPAGSGTGGTILFPTALKTELMATLTEQLNKYPDN